MISSRLVEVKQESGLFNVKHFIELKKGDIFKIVGEDDDRLCLAKSELYKKNGINTIDIEYV